MGKRRNTVKTGDKAIYKGRSAKYNVSNKRRSGEDDDDNNMYNEIDRFHNERDQEEFIRFGDAENGEDGDEDDKDLMGNTEAVLDLGIGGDSSSSDEDDDADDDYSSVEQQRNAHDDAIGGSESSSESGSYSDSDSDDDDDDIKNLKEQLKSVSEDPRKWGKKKSMYYHGDTADLEIGQEEEDAFLEEEAAKEVQASRFQEMDEDDFVLSDNEVDPKPSEETTTRAENIKSIRDITKLSKKEAKRLLRQQHPELLPMVSYFADIVKDLRDRTDVATNALIGDEGNAETVGATIEGQQYLLTKAMLQKSIALNAVIYLLLKSQATFNDDGTDSIKAHPITDQLKVLYMALEKLEERVNSKAPGLNEQIDTLVKAAALMNRGTADDNDDDSDQSDVDDIAVAENESVDQKPVEMGFQEDGEEKVGSKYFEEDRTVPIATIENQNDQYRTLNEARFCLRPGETKKLSKSPKKRSSSYTVDFGDLDEGISDPKMLASTINSIQQRSQVASKKRRPAPIAEQLDDPDEHDDRLAQGIKMMEEELGKLDDNDIADGASGSVGSVHDHGMDDPDFNDESLSFYETMKKKTKSQKSFKSNLYQVAPKFPRGDSLVDGERAISRTIFRNRGLVAHKAKINRNPRVKKREQFRKALIRRKGAVREVREGEGHKYGGEGTGIKSGISRSRKLTSKK